MGPHCDKTHPFLGFKTVKFINWPSRAFREPDERDGLMTVMWYKKCKFILEKELRYLFDIPNYEDYKNDSNQIEQYLNLPEI